MRSLALAILLLPLLALAGVSTSSFTYSSTIDPSITDLYGEISIPSTGGPFPVLWYGHGYTASETSSQAGATGVPQDFREIMATNGGFAVVVLGLRQRDNAGGHQDDGGRETHDIADGIRYVWANYSSQTITNNLVAAGGSGGGGNNYNLLMKHPDLARYYVVYFGISDYGYKTNLMTYSGNGVSWWDQQHPALLSDSSFGARGVMARNTMYPRTSGGGFSGNPYDSFQPYWLNNYRSRCAVEGVPKNLFPATWIWFAHNNLDTTVFPDCSYAMTNALTLAGVTNWTARFSDTLYPHGTIHVLPDGWSEWSPQGTNGSYPVWTVPTTATCRIMGYMETKRFSIWLGNGTNGVADLTYNTLARTYDVTPLTGSTPITITQDGVTTNATLTTETVYTLPGGPATWYVDSAATGANDGTSWANAYTNFYAIPTASVAPGDTIEVSGGLYRANANYDQWECHWGLTNQPVTIKHSRAVGHSGLATIRVPLAIQAFVNIDGSYADNYETNFITGAAADGYPITRVPDVRKLTNNCGFWIDGGSNWIYDVLTIEGYRTDRPGWAISQYCYSNVIKWCVLAGGAPPPGQDVHDIPGLVNLDCIKGPNLINGYGLEVCYNYFTNIIEASVSCGNNVLGFSTGVQIHHNYVAYGQNRSIGALFGGAVGPDIYCNIINEFPQVLGGEQEDLQLPYWWRVYNNIFYVAGAATIQCYIDSGSNYSHCYFYGNLIVPNPTNWNVYPTLGNTYVQMSSEPTAPAQCVTNIYCDDWRFFNNTAICTTNGPGAVLGFLAKGWLVSPNGSCPSYATNTDLCVMTVPAGGVKFYNNLDWSPDGSKGSGFSPEYSAFNGDAATKCFGGLCGFGKFNGWRYDNAGVLVDYNVFGGTHYLSNNLTMAFTPATLQAYAGFSHNYTNMPSLRNLDGEDFRPTSTASGVNLSEYATNMPGLGYDLNGVARTWGIGALEPSSASFPTDGLVCHLTFDDEWGSSNKIADVSGHGMDFYNFPWTAYPSNCWPARVASTNTLRDFGYAASFERARDFQLGYDLFDGYVIRQFGGCTNVALVTNLTAMTVSAWMLGYSARSNDVHQSWNDAILDSGYAEAGTWILAQHHYDERSSFAIRTTPGAEQGGYELFFPNPTDTGNTTNWHMFSAVVNCTNSTLTLYLDGTNCASASIPTVSHLTVSADQQPFWIALGCQTHNFTPWIDTPGTTPPLYLPDGSGDKGPNDGWADSAIDEVMIYNRALSADEVLQIYNGTGGGGGGPNPPQDNSQIATRLTGNTRAVGNVRIR